MYITILCGMNYVIIVKQNEQDTWPVCCFWIFAKYLSSKLARLST